ncbi:MAG: heme-binding domain-containing protein [Ardenticatenaceae bacterium]|nr:heme-binding domain-containing protein [Ardenticatenaceae bacterium]
MPKFLQLRRENRSIFIACVAGAILALLLLQLWPTDTSNPPVISTPTWEDAEVAQLAERACYDCHSHETEWPWYTKIVPAYFLMAGDVQRGRQMLNFSKWEETCCTKEQIDDMATAVTKNHMPLPYYLVLHPEARLNRDEQGQLVYGLMEVMNERLEAGD